MKNISIISLLLLACGQEGLAFAPSTSSTISTTSPSGSTSTQINVESRREVLKNSVATFVSATAGYSLFPSIANAAESQQDKLDKENLVKGYKRLQYLLDNWDRETTICGRTDNPYIGCERTPEKVMVYLGFKSMNDPLFRADKAMFRLQKYVDSDLEIDYIEAVELFSEKAEEASNTAFISSWGEANPGGGKDRVEMFIERSRKQVETAKDSLGTAIKLLGLEIK